MLVYELNSDGFPVLRETAGIGPCGFPHTNNRNRGMVNWKNPRVQANEWEELIIPAYIRLAEARCGPWHLWTRSAQAIVHGTARQYSVYKTLRTASDNNTLINTDYTNWYVRTGRNNNSIFDMGRSNNFTMLRRPVAFECQRCGRSYNRSLRKIPAVSSHYTVQFPFPYCPANKTGRCHLGRTDRWVESQMEIEKYHQKATEETMNVLGSQSPVAFITAAFPGTQEDLNGMDQIRAGYKALRIIWIRAFTAPPRMSNAAGIPYPIHHVLYGQAHTDGETQYPQRGKPVHPHDASYHRLIGEVSMWGDLVYDLQLLREGHITEVDLTYMYGMSLAALKYIVYDICGSHDIDWLNAYVGMRHRVPHSQYRLMKTSIQRAAVAMERLLDVGRASAELIVTRRREYALNGMFFHELYSALCANSSVMFIAGFIRVHPPLSRSSWRHNTMEAHGKRLFLPLIDDIRYIRRVGEPESKNNQLPEVPALPRINERMKVWHGGLC